MPQIHSRRTPTQLMYQRSSVKLLSTAPPLRTMSMRRVLSLSTSIFKNPRSHANFNPSYNALASIWNTEETQLSL
ncbi:hypothetical protein GOBAR_AA25374 [Gossypium barbadense]|uniref:Uncharacterized protein n=1 Tax=Gossypium barbadense TaxID=3634 RepID=A0A2P5WW30_GOSBA|nr:hypothetical protein GOBAR_AA25374 [Gossypium barbadense]